MAGLSASVKARSPSGANAREDGYRGLWFTLGQFSNHETIIPGGWALTRPFTRRWPCIRLRPEDVLHIRRHAKG